MSDDGLQASAGYRRLEIWQLARDLSVEIHRMTVECLPTFEMYEEGAQIRRSAKSIRANIVEGYGRRRYKHDFIRFLTIALASCRETTDHLETLQETHSLTDRDLYDRLHAGLDMLGRKLTRFVQGVDTQHDSVREDPILYGTDDVI